MRVHKWAAVYSIQVMMNESLPLPAECLKQSETTLVQAVVLLGSIISLQIVKSKVLKSSTAILLPSDFKDQMI